MSKKDKELFNLENNKKKQNNTPDFSEDLPPQPDFGGEPTPPITYTQPIQNLEDEKVTPNTSIKEPLKKMTTNDDNFDSEDDADFDIFRYLSIILRHRYVVFATGITAFILSLLSFFGKQDIYTAKTRLLYKPFRSEQIVRSRQSSELWMDRENQLLTFMEMLKSTEIIKRVISNLSLDISPSGLRNKIKIDRIERTSIIEIITKDKDPYLGADIANELAETLIEYNIRVNTQDITRTIKTLEKQIKKTGEELKEKENILTKFQEKNQFVNVSEEIQLEIRKLSELELNLQRTKLEIEETKKRLVKINTELHKQNIDVKLEMELAQKEMELATSKGRYGEKHPQTKAKILEINSLKNLIKQSKKSNIAFSDNPIVLNLAQELSKYRTNLVAAETKRIELVKAINLINKSIGKLPSKELEQIRLIRDKSIVENSFKMLTQKLEEAKIYRDSQASSIVQIEKATVPEFPISSKSSRSILIGTLIGLLIGIAIAFIMEYLDQTIKDPEEAEKILKLPIIGSVPEIPESMTGLDNEIANEKIMEPYRIVRTNLQYSMPGSGTKIFMITSAVQSEGKSSQAARLAVSFALDGKKVLLIDADLRRSAQHRIFRVDRDIGLSEHLTGQASLDQIIKATIYPNLSLITAGAKPPNPAEILGSNSMDTFLENMRGKYDVVIIDTPATLPVTDSKVLCTKADGIILIIRAFRTQIKAAIQTKTSIERLGGHFVGCVHNCVPVIDGYLSYFSYHSYYGYHGYHYEYSNYSEEGTLEELSMTPEIEKGLEKWSNLVSNVRNEKGLFGKVSVLGQWIKGMEKRSILILSLFCLLISLALGLYVKSYFNNKEIKSIRTVHNGKETFNDKSINNTEDNIALEKNNLDSLSAIYEWQKNFYDWEKAFNNRNLEGFLSFYSTDNLHTPVGQYKEWESYQQKRFQKHSTAKLNVGNLDYIHKTGKKIVINFPVTIVYPKGKIKTYFRQYWLYKDGVWKIKSEKIL